MPIGFTRVHHAAWWKRDHGPTSVDNGIALCPRCHLLVHDRGWSLEFEPGTTDATWTSPAGRTITTRPQPRLPGPLESARPTRHPVRPNLARELASELAPRRARTSDPPRFNLGFHLGTLAGIGIPMMTGSCALCPSPRGWAMAGGDRLEVRRDPAPHPSWRPAPSRRCLTPDNRTCAVVATPHRATADPVIYVRFPMSDLSSLQGPHDPWPNTAT